MLFHIKCKLIFTFFGHIVLSIIRDPFISSPELKAQVSFSDHLSDNNEIAEKH